MSVQRPSADKCIECSTATVWLDPRGFVVVDQVPRALQTGPTAAEMMAAARKLVPGTGLIPMLVLANESRTDRDARQTFTEATHNACVGLVINSKVSEVTGNFFMRINRPPYPMRLFGDVDDAIAWVLEYVPRP